MLDLLKTPRLMVENINWMLDANGQHAIEYWGKIVVDAYSVCYCSRDGRCMSTIICSISNSNEDESIKASVLLDEIIQKQYETRINIAEGPKTTANNASIAEGPITYPIWDVETNQEMWTTKTLDNLIKNPELCDIEFLGLHFLNSLRISRNLEPMPPQRLNGRK